MFTGAGEIVGPGALEPGPGRLLVVVNATGKQNMIRMTRALAAWNSTTFEHVLKDELQQLDCSTLPLQQGLVHGSVALDDVIHPVILSVSHDADVLRIRAGLQYHGMIAGCSCADDPTPDSPTLEYCTVQIEIDRDSADTRITLLADPP